MGSGVDDVTGEPLIQRDDDVEETIRNATAIGSLPTPLKTWRQNHLKSPLKNCSIPKKNYRKNLRL